MSSSMHPQPGDAQPDPHGATRRAGPSPSAQPSPTGLRDLSRFYRIFARHYTRHIPLLLTALASLLVGIGLALLVPWPLAWMIDHVIKAEPLPDWMAGLGPWIESEPHQALAAFAACFVLIKLLHAVFTFVDKYLVAAVSEYIATEIRERAFAHLQRLSLSFHRRVETSDIIFRLTRDITDIRELLVSQPEALIRSAITILAFAGLMLWLEWKLALVAFSILPLLFAMAYWTQARVRGAEGKRKEKESKLALVLNENVRALSLVQAYGQERAERDLFDAENRGSLEADVRLVKLTRRFKRATDLLVASATAGVLYLGGRAVLGDGLTLGAFVVFYTYVEELYGPVDKLVTTLLGFARNQVAGQRILEIIESDMVTVDREGAVPAPPLEGRLEFESVSFRYGKGPPVLEDVSFVIEPGETCALVGASGAGKSTLISLLLRFFDPDSGRILMDDRDIRDYQIASLRSQLTILPQEATLLRRSLRENLAFGRPDASEDEILRSAERAQAHGFISALPAGYDHVVTERGGDLSGGQRQRIHIARAMLRDAPVLILDEPFVGLDAESEAAVHAALSRLMEQRTVLVIAHRLATIQAADRILLLEGGRIAEQGTHEQLIASSSRYRELYEQQLVKPTAA